jgi:hypothetical protein
MCDVLCVCVPPTIPRCNQINTSAEVRNKSIGRRIDEGKEWLDLDPTRKEEYAEAQQKARDEKKASAAAANAPVTAKVASTGGPYSLKQLSCDKKFRPDDIDEGNRELSLGDEEFNAVLGMTKEAWASLAKWKKTGAKKKNGLF